MLTVALALAITFAGIAGLIFVARTDRAADPIARPRSHVRTLRQWEDE